jgi:hypothetical protein
MTKVDTMARWHDVVRRRSAEGLEALLADDVVFHSPIVHTPQVGKGLTTMYLTAALHVIANDTFRYVREIVGSHDAALEFQAEIDGISVNGIDLIRWNDEGRIVDFKVMVRPLKAVNLLHAQMRAMLEAMKDEKRG